MHNLTTIQLSYLVRFMGNLAVRVLWSKKLGGPKFRKPLSLLSSWKLNNQVVMKELNTMTLHLL